jgi:hypothetical protein
VEGGGGERGLRGGEDLCFGHGCSRDVLDCEAEERDGPIMRADHEGVAVLVVRIRWIRGIVRPACDQQINQIIYAARTNSRVS